jgi:hypothetical protein
MLKLIIVPFPASLELLLCYHSRFNVDSSKTTIIMLAVINSKCQRACSAYERRMKGVCGGGGNMSALRKTLAPFTQSDGTWLSEPSQRMATLHPHSVMASV